MTFLYCEVKERTIFGYIEILRVTSYEYLLDKYHSIDLSTTFSSRELQRVGNSYTSCVHHLLPLSTCETMLVNRNLSLLHS
jgi:hypothetical protein